MRIKGLLSSISPKILRNIGGRLIRGSALWVPTNIDGCILWLRSDLGITMDGSNRVSNWADQSGNGNDFAQSTDAAKPIYTANTFNGLGGLVFGTIGVMSDDTLYKTGGISLAQPLTIVTVVVNVDTNTTSVQTFFRDSLVTCLQDMVGREARLYAGTSLASGTMDFSHLGDYICESQYNGVSCNYLVNDVSKVSGDAGSSGLTGTTTYIGSYGSVGFMIATCMEVLLYGKIFSAGDRTALYTYFNNRYGL